MIFKGTAKEGVRKPVGHTNEDIKFEADFLYKRLSICLC